MPTAVKVRKQFILDPKKIKKVRKITKAKTDTEAIDKAMDEIIANNEIIALHKAIRGKGNIKDVYGRLKD